jgi:hypothetical protein
LPWITYVGTGFWAGADGTDCCASAGIADAGAVSTPASSAAAVAAPASEAAWPGHQRRARAQPRRTGRVNIIGADNRPDMCVPFMVRLGAARAG